MVSGIFELLKTKHRKESITMSYTHLTPTERGQIQAFLKQGCSFTEIAKELGRDVSTVWRECRRNGTSQRYRAEQAQRTYERRRCSCRPKGKLAYPALLEYVRSRIRDDEYSPELVALRLRRDYPEDERMRISHESIYRAIYTQPHLRFLRAMLTQARPKRRKRGQGKSRRGPSIPNRVGIEQRPTHIETRQERGHWEADTIVGKGQRSFIITLVERKFRILCAIQVGSKHASDVAQAIIESLSGFPLSWLKTITFDNGTEFAGHETIARALNLTTYFADPYSAWQRGTNEQTNGLIRRYLPKGTCFNQIAPSRLTRIVQILNERPRKCLDALTPNESFHLWRQSATFALRA